MRSVHAGPISLRVGLAVTALMLGYAWLGVEEPNVVSGSFVAASIAFGFAAVGISYVIVYLAENFFNNIQDRHYEPVQVKPRPMPADAPKLKPPEKPGNVMDKLAKAILVDGMPFVSKRRLDEYDVISRYDPKSDELIEKLRKEEYIKDAGNNQFEITDKLRKYLLDYRSKKEPYEQHIRPSSAEVAK